MNVIAMVKKSSKTCKSFLKLGTEYHGLSYDALTAHTAFVFLRYMFMSV
ncbi:hypothetical protein ME804_18000 [Lactobacillus delbrueckii]|nr:hypothetical protein ME804_18000 [Lactobacillus delbrueckii]